jgi:signal transduction histidine kinase
VNVKRLLESGLMMIAEKARKHMIQIDVNIQEKLGKFSIRADEVKLKQILVNLLSNAAKFTPDGGRIDLSAYEEADEIVISVADTGIGLRPQDQDRIFAPFEQLEQSPTSRHTQGTGLGLALAKSLVELHGGRIWVRSEGIGKGSTFSFAIPIRHNPQGMEGRPEK